MRPLLKLLTVLVFHVAMVIAFATIYRYIGFDETNFNGATPEIMQSPLTPIYYSLQNQVQLAYGDVYSASVTARLLSMTQIALSYMSLYAIMFLL